MKLLLISILSFTLLSKPGILINTQTHQQIKLICADKNDDCYFHLQLQDGIYTYVSNDNIDSITLLISHGYASYVGAQNKQLTILQ